MKVINYMMITTKRLRLRPWTKDDTQELKRFLQDEDVMYAYEHAFSDSEVQRWLNWNLESYADNGYGLWAIELKSTGEVIGECGLTKQGVNGQQYLEIGYHLIKDFWHHGYALEAAQACKDYAFNKLNSQQVVSIVRDTNIPSMNVAIRNGMTVKTRFVKHYYDMDMPHYLFMAEKK